MLQFNLHHHTQSNLRFAYSPLLELVISYRVLQGNWKQPSYWRWLEEANRAIHDIDYPYMNATISSGNTSKAYLPDVPNGYIPDFLTPTPTQPINDIEVELERLLQVPHEIVQHCMQVMIASEGETDLRCQFLAHPAKSMQALVAELRDYWHRTLAHHWHRMVAVLENDILHHSRVLTLNGLETLFPTLHTKLAYEDGTISVGKPKPHCPDTIQKGMIFDITSETFHLVPVIFAASGVYFQTTDAWQPMILYTSRGAGLWNYELPEPSEALELTLGAGKSRILLALATPYSTGELARKLSLTAGAVSQQLGKMNQAGLVESHRSGKHVFYRLSARGKKLVELFC